jgi:tyrosyl-tRNA synthetase
MKISTDTQKIDQLLHKRVVEVIVAEDLRKKLLSGKRLRIKFGADPTAPDLHLGHAVLLKKLREFQELGHQVILLIGDYTARIGDPTGKSKTRPMLTEKEVKANAKTYLAQAGKVLDLKKVEVRWNSEWFGKMKFADIIALTSRFTVARMIERDDFDKRLTDGVDVHMHELLYPMMQAHDSIAIKADVELGSTDQRFNMLAGRDLQRKLGEQEQDVMIVGPLLVGTDGVKKMSKSLGNYIGITEAPEEMYGKIMSIPDSVLWDYFTMTTELPEEEIRVMREICAKGEMNPRDAKARLAREIVTTYHSARAAEKAEEQFRSMFQKKEVPEDVPEMTVTGGERLLIEVLVETQLATSKGEARRLVEQGGVKMDGKVVKDPQTKMSVSNDGVLLQKGKRYFVKVKAKK